MKKRTYFEISADETIENFQSFNAGANVMAEFYEQLANTRIKILKKSESN